MKYPCDMQIYHLAQMKTSESVGSEPLRSKVHIGCIRINFNIAFSRTRNDNCMTFHLHMEIQSSTKEGTMVYMFLFYAN